MAFNINANYFFNIHYLDISTSRGTWRLEHSNYNTNIFIPMFYMGYLRRYSMVVMTKSHATHRLEQVRLILGRKMPTKQFNRFSLLFTYYRNFGR